jgi:MFS family permease
MQRKTTKRKPKAPASPPAETAPPPAPPRRPVARRSNLWRFAGAALCLLGTAVGIVSGVLAADLPGWREIPAWVLVALSVIVPFWLLGLPLVLVPTFIEFRQAGMTQAVSEIVRQVTPWGRYSAPPPPPAGGDQEPQV